MEVSLLSYVLLGLLTFVFVIWKRRRSQNTLLKGVVLPEPPGLPFIGHSVFFDMGNLHFRCAEYAERYGKLFQLRIFAQKIVVINDYKVVKKAFAGEEYGDIFNDRPDSFTGGYLYKGFENRNGCLGRLDDTTKVLRKILHKGLKVFGEGAEKFEKHVQDDLSRLVAEIGKQGRKDIDISQFLKESFSNWMSSLLTGQAPSDDDYKIIWDWAEWADTIWSPDVNLVLESFPFLRNLPGKYGNICRSTINARDKVLDRFVNPRHLKEDGLIKFIYAMQKEENEKAGYELIDECYVVALIQDLVFVGVTTTYAALINSFALLLHYPEIAAKIQEETDRVVGRTRAPGLNDRRKMPYTKATLLEILRYTSQNPLPIPRVTNADTILEGYHIQKGSQVFYNSWVIHHDPKIWTDPWKFRPDRFLDAEGKILSPEHELRQAVVTFSFGKRSCPGETLAMTRLFLYITRVLQEFDLRPPTSDRFPITDPRFYKPGLDLRVEDFLCQAVPRRRET